MFIDMHVHPAFYEPINQDSELEELRHNTLDIHKNGTAPLEHIFNQMKCAGLDYLCLLPEDYRTQQGGKVLVSNEEISQLVNMAPDKFIGFAGVDPFAEDAAEELEKAFAELKLSGLKLHPGKGHFYPTDERMMPLYDICEKYDVTISLGDACRPGCLADATDVCQIEELVRLGELTKRAWDHNVQVMVEGPGHMPMDQIAANMKIQNTICGGAPFYVLGPLVTDIAPGYDHITSAIGGAIAAASGAAFLCYVTPAEHLALPNLEDVKQGIIASKIAAHAADIAKGVRGAREMDDRMADARRKLDWEAQWECAIDPETAKRIREERKPEHEDTCSMCGKFCAVRSMNKALAGEHIDIL